MPYKVRFFTKKSKEIAKFVELSTNCNFIKSSGRMAKIYQIEPQCQEKNMNNGSRMNLTFNVIIDKFNGFVL